MSLIYPEWECASIVFVGTQIEHTYRHIRTVHTETPGANSLRHKQPGPEASNMTPLGKVSWRSQLRVQISRVHINAQLGLCTPLFSPPTSSHDGFFMLLRVLPSFPQLWYDYKQIRIYVIIFACGWFLLFFFLICEDKQLWSWDGAVE